MSSPSPPKPWERAGVGSSSSSNVSDLRPLFSASNATLLPPPTTSRPAPPSRTISNNNNSLSTTTTTTMQPRPSSSTSSSSSMPPPLPSRPRTLNSVVNRTAANYGPYGPTMTRFGTAGPGGGGYGYGSGAYGTYASPYSRYGGAGGMYGGGYGSGIYGGGVYGGGYGGPYGGGPPGGPFQPDPNDPNSLTNTLGQSTQATFQIIESIVGAFGGFAQMLESTYMATHSSFFAMVSVAEQFSNLRNTLGSIFGIFALIRWIKSIIGSLTRHQSSSTELTASSFASFEKRQLQRHQHRQHHQRLSSSTTGPNIHDIPLRPSKKPLFVFFLAVFGIPYLISRLVKNMSNGKSTPQPSEGATSSLVPGTAAAAMMDPTQLEFCRVLYDFSPELLGVGGGGSNNGGGTRTNNTELNVKKGDLVAVLSKLDPTTGLPSEWWRCRTRDGRVGWLPGVWMEVIQRSNVVKPPALTTTATTRGEVVKAITGPSGNSNSGGGGQTSGATTTTVMNGTTTATSSNSSIPKELNAQRRQDGNTSSHEPGTMNNKDKDKEKDMMMRILENKEPGYTFTGGGLWNTGTSTGAANGIVDTNSSTITNGSGSGSGNADGNKGEKEKEGMVSVDGFRKSSFYNK